ncbi:hypothetical protein D9M71_225530 [compost metagenome]
MQRLALNPGGLAKVNVITLHQRVEGALTYVLVVVAAQQVIQHAFTQGAFAMVHALQFQCVENRLHDRKASRENGTAVGFDALEVDFLDFAQLEQLALEPGQAFGIDLATALVAGL